MRFTFLSVCVLLFVGLATASQGKRCLRRCTKEYRPVCGKNQAGDHREFSNECERLNYNCMHPDSGYELEEEGRCPHRLCTRLCTKDYHPVCGSNAEGQLRTFSNECERKNYNCRNPEGEYEYVRDGTCTLRLCTRLCTKEYVPVCGRNPEGQLRRFNNECLMANYNCSHPGAEYEVVPNETCPPRLCNRLCTHEHNPVCARNPEGLHRTFRSECEMKNYNCEHPESEYVVVQNGTCPTRLCTRLCPHESHPLCGKNQEGDHHTFSSECEMENYNCAHPGSEYEHEYDGNCTQGKRSAQCPEICPLLYLPVCGKNPQGEYETFPNKCLLEVANCRQPESPYVVVSNTTCENRPASPETTPTDNCPTVCTLIYSPICASNAQGSLRTFANECELKGHNCKNPDSVYERVSQGECSGEDEPDCPERCPKLYKPVCGKTKEGDRKTFPNACELKKYNCNNADSKYELQSVGSCNQQEHSEDCQHACPLVFIPVCIRTPQGDLQTFANECELDIYKCHNPNSGYEQVGQGTCDKYGEEGEHPETNCPKWCTREYLPICGKNSEGDHRTFPNSCELRRYNCENTDSHYEPEHNGSCTQHKRSEHNEVCPEHCNMMLRPVCGTTAQGERRTFANECHLNGYNCLNPNTRYEVLHNGSC